MRASLVTVKLEKCLTENKASKAGPNNIYFHKDSREMENSQ